MKKKSIVLNEIDYAERRLADKDFPDGEMFALKILAKYCYHQLGQRKKQICESLKKFMEESCETYTKNKMFWDNVINDIVKNASKHNLFCIDGVWITESEVSAISSIEEKNMRQVAFAFLCIAKYNNAKNPNANSWVNMEYKDLFDLANYKCSQNERIIIISNLVDTGFLALAKENANLSCHVLFVNEESDKKFMVSDFRCLGYEYLKYCGENFIRCSDCGILTHGNKNGTKRYCSKCSGVERMVLKEVVCVDCGDVFTVSSKDNSSCRCTFCRDEYRRQYLREAKKRQREREDVNSANKR